MVADPVFVRVTVVAVEFPGSIARSPPYLLIVEHVALFVEILPPSVELQTELPDDSCSEIVPDPAVFAEFVMDAVKAATAGLMDPARTNEANTPHSAAIRARRRTVCVKVETLLARASRTVAPILSPTRNIKQIL
jgi:hypothetical protein